MTNQPELPTPAEALGAAYAIVRTPCSAAETARATLLFEIARELRVAADMRALNARRAGVEAEVAKRKLRAAGVIDRSVWDRAVAPAGVEGLAEGVLAAAAEAATATFPAFADQTQRLPIVWHVGDKADCRHCHTPIIFEARRMSDPMTQSEGDPQYVWVHKYTDQRTCAVATMSSDDAEPTHTFAEPAPR